MPRPAGQLQRELRRVSAACGGEDQLAFLLHVQPRTVWSYLSGRSRPIRTVCIQLARICRTLDGDGSPKATAEWWQALAAEQVEA